MLKKLLLILKNLAEEVLPQNLLKKGKNPERQSSPSPNLLTPVDTAKKIQKVRSGLVPAANYLVLGTAFVFVVLLSVNFYYDTRLKSLTKERDELILKIDMSAEVYDRAKYLFSLIELYKGVKTQNSGLSDSLEQVVASMGDKINYNSLSYDRGKKVYSLSTSTDSAANYAIFINSLLEKDFVQNITLESVSLSSRANSYTATFGIATK